MHLRRRERLRLRDPRQPHLGLGKLEREAEGRGQDADHGDVLAVQAEGASDDGRIAAEAAMPEAIGDHGGIRAARGHLGGIERASERWRHSQQAEEIAGDARARDLLGLGLAAEARADRVVDGDAREALRLVPDGFVFGEGHGDGAGLRVRGDLRNRDQAVRVAEGQRPQEDRIHHAEDRGRRPDAESQGEDGDGAESWVLNDPPQPVADVLKEGPHLRDLTLSA
jgi:hypothetical protein